MRPSAPCSLKRLRSIFRSLGKPANLAGGVVRPHRNSVTHGKPPQFAIWNHASVDSGIPRESATQRIGISRGHSGRRASDPFFDRYALAGGAEFLLHQRYILVEIIAPIELAARGALEVAVLVSQCWGVVSLTAEELFEFVADGHHISEGTSPIRS